MVIRPWYGGTIAIVPYNCTHVIRDAEGGNHGVGNGSKPFRGTGAERFGTVPYACAISAVAACRGLLFLAFERL